VKRGGKKNQRNEVGGQIMHWVYDGFCIAAGLALFELFVVRFWRLTLAIGLCGGLWFLVYVFVDSTNTRWPPAVWATLAVVVLFWVWVRWNEFREGFIEGMRERQERKQQARKQQEREQQEREQQPKLETPDTIKRRDLQSDLQRCYDEAMRWEKEHK
jgi:type VI protein secretion system component VasK